MGEIMLNKSFGGSWGVASEENIPHEIINIFQSDNGKIYLYVPSHGGYATSKHDVKYLLITGEWNQKEKSTEILYLASGLKRMHNGGKYATPDEREKLKKKIREDNIRYNGKLLDEIKMSAEEEDRVFFCTFEAEKLIRPQKRMFLVWNGGADSCKADFEKFGLSDENYNYQRQIGYIDNPKDYQKLLSIISNSKYWGKDNAASPVTQPANTVSSFNFLKLIHKEYDETIYTNLFFEFFSKNNTLFNLFAKEVLGLPGDDSYSIRKEVKTSDCHGRLDLLAVGEKNVIAIENKIKSGLNGIDKHNELSQLTTYIEFIETEHADKAKKYFLFEPDYNDIDIAKFDGKRGCEFHKIRYSEIYDFFARHREIIKQGVYANYADDFIASLYIHTMTMHDIVEQRFLSAIQQN